MNPKTPKTKTKISTSPLDDPALADFVTRLVKAGETDTSVLRQVERGFGIQTSLDSLRRFRHRHQLTPTSPEPVYTRVNGESAECSMPVSNDPQLADPDTMLKQRGLDPSDWYIEQMHANEWGLPDSRSYQSKFTAKRRTPYVGLVPVRDDGWKPPKRNRRPRDQDDSDLVVICGDQQTPFHDQNLHRLFCDWLSDYVPDRGVVLGDLGDFPDISRHPRDPENLAEAQECLQSSYEVMRDYVGASTITEWDYLLGNHDERIRQYLLKNAPALYGLRQVDTEDGPGAAVHHLSHLLRLDELGVNLIEPHGTYENAQVRLSDNLAVRHGWIARKGSGTSALQTLQQTGFSIIVGHTHRQSCVYHTYHEMDGGTRQLMAVEAGCMCRVDGKAENEQERRYPASNRRYPNYMTLPDWQQGFCTATVYPDGKFSVDLAKYVNGVLLWRDRCYE